MKRFLALGVVVAALMAFPATSAWAANPHQVTHNELTCTEVNLAVHCVGDIAGLGSASNVNISVEADLACEVRPGKNRPGGHLQGFTGPLPVKSGRVTVDVTTPSASCPQGLNPVVGDTATITVTDADTGAVLATFQVDIT
jgi:hypothetical protein